MDYLQLVFFDGRKDIHTLEFAPYERREQTSSDYQFPDEIYNEMGFRGSLPESGKKVMVALGDSFTEGAGAPADSSYPVLLQHLLHSSDTGIAVMNAGVSGNDIFFDWKMLEKISSRFDITDAIFLVNTTDLYDISTRGGKERFLPNGSLKYRDAPFWEPLYAVSYVFRLLAHQLLKVDFTLFTAEKNKELRDEATLKIGSLLIDDIIPYSKKNNIRITVALHPMTHEIEQETDEYRHLRELLEALEGIQFIDTRHAFTKYPEPHQLYWKNDRHFKPEGYYLLASYISDYLNEKVSVTYSR